MQETNRKPDPAGLCYVRPGHTPEARPKKEACRRPVNMMREWSARPTRWPQSNSRSLSPRVDRDAIVAHQYEHLPPAQQPIRNIAADSNSRWRFRLSPPEDQIMPMQEMGPRCHARKLAHPKLPQRAASTHHKAEAVGEADSPRIAIQYSRRSAHHAATACNGHNSVRARLSCLFRHGTGPR